MKIKIISTLCILSAFIACEMEPTSKPMSNQKMTLILRDLMIAEAVASGKTGTEADSIKKIYMDTIFSVYQIDSEKLLRIEHYLQDHPDSSLQLHQKARNALEELQQSVN